MVKLVRALNSIGIEQFRAYLDALRSGDSSEPPWALLDDPACTSELTARAEVDTREFGSRWSAAEYLVKQLATLPAAEVENNRGLWAWLSLLYFDQVCPAA